MSLKTDNSETLFFKENQTVIPISKTDESEAARFEVRFVAWRLAQSRLPDTILTPRWPWRTEVFGSAKLTLTILFQMMLFKVVIFISLLDKNIHHRRNWINNKKVRGCCGFFGVKTEHSIKIYQVAAL